MKTGIIGTRFCWLPVRTQTITKSGWIWRTGKRAWLRKVVVFRTVWCEEVLLEPDDSIVTGKP